MHIHNNVPGVLREVNQFFSSRGINITAEYLQTDPELGYVIIETESELDSTVIKDLKVKGSSSVVKVGTKVKNIRLVEGDHDIDCKIDGIGAMKLKSEFVKKA